MRDILAGRVSGGLLYPEAEMLKNLPYYLRIDNKADDFHLSSAARTTEEVRPTIENCMLRAIVWNHNPQDFITQ